MLCLRDYVQKMDQEEEAESDGVMEWKVTMMVSEGCFVLGPSGGLHQAAGSGSGSSYQVVHDRRASQASQATRLHYTGSG